MLDVSDKKYIDVTINTAIDRSHKKFQEDTERYLGTLMEKTQHEMGLMREFMSSYPTKDDVREMIQEETPIIVRKVIREEIAPIMRDYGGRIRKLEKFAFA